MSRNDDISNLFRKSAENMDVRPSSGARLRFEQRLGNRRKYRESNLQKYMMMIAAVVAALCAISVLAIYDFGMKTPGGVADNKTSAPAIELTEDAMKIAEAKELHKRELAEDLAKLDEAVDDVVVAEETLEEEKIEFISDKEVKKNTTTSIPETYEVTTNAKEMPKPGSTTSVGGVKPKAEPTPPAPKPIAKPKPKMKPTPKPAKSKDANFEVTDDVVLAEKKDNAPVPRIATPTTSAPMEYPVKEKMVVAEEMEMDDAAGVELESVSIASTKTKSSKRDNKKRRSKKYKNSTYSPSAGGPKTQSVQNFAKIKPFNWLIGKWKDEANSKTTVEEWKKIGPSELQGKGYVVIDGQETFREDLSIILTGDDVYYVMALDAKNTKVYFKLKSYKNNKAIFENDGSAFPNQVIIEKHSNRNFSTTLQNNSVQFKNEQQQYLMQRNAVMDQKAKRNMTRSANK